MPKEPTAQTSSLAVPEILSVQGMIKGLSTSEPSPVSPAKALSPGARLSPREGVSAPLQAVTDTDTVTNTDTDTGTDTDTIIASKTSGEKSRARVGI